MIESEPIPYKLKGQLKKDCEEAIGNAMVKNVADIGHAVLCGCRGCIGEAKRINEYWGLPGLPAKDEARILIAEIEKRL